jgi:peptidyl-prolyl cis-trans isomerase A (cyclophilin A)
MTRWVLGALCGAFAMALAAAPAEAQTEGKLQPGVYAYFITSEGDFTVHLFDKDVPKTVENFVGLAQGTKAWTDPKTGQLVKRPYYNGLIFHRVIDGFMIQGGDPLGSGSGGPGYTFADEFSPKLRHNKAGILSMANRGPNTNGGQFFITLGPTPHLDNLHSIFGEVVQGMDVVAKIGKVKAANSRPVTPVVIKSVKIEKIPGA